jgi:hypothetical protein
MSERGSPQRRQSEGYRREKRAQEALWTTEIPIFARLLLEKAHPRQKFIVADFLQSEAHFGGAMFFHGFETRV